MENDIQLNSPINQSLHKAQVSQSTNWIKILLFVVLGIIVISGSIFLGIKVGKNQERSRQSVIVQPTISPTQIIINPTVETTNPTISKTSDWKTYINESYNFSLKYSSDFSPDEIVGEGQQLASISFGLMKNGGFYIDISTGDSIEYYKNQIIDHSSGKIDKEEITTVDGISATKLTYKQIIVIDEFEVSRVIVKHDNVDYIITAFASDIDKILSTFKFTD